MSIIILVFCPLYCVDDYLGVMEDDIRFGETNETSADLQRQIQEEGSLTKVALTPTPLLQSVEGGSLNVTVFVQGNEHRLPDFALAQLQISMDLARRYHRILCTTLTPTYKERELSSHLLALTESFSRSAAEAAALADAGRYENC